MKKTLLLLFVFSISMANAQYNADAPWMRNIQKSKSQDRQPTFQEMQTAFNQYWETRDPNKKGSGYKPFKRWEYIWENVVDQEGYLPTSMDKWKAWEAKSKSSTKSSATDLSNWNPLGPYTHTNTGSWSSGQARINVIAIDPNTTSTWYVGTPAGGLWKSTNSGADWNPLTDNLPQIGVSGIAIDHSNSNIIYIATGDDDGADTSSAGVFKSTDGGTTWNQTGLNPENTPSSMNEIYMHPSNTNILWVATNNGIFKTTNAGTTWNNILSGNIKDLKLKPGDPNTMYAVTTDRFFKSENGGSTFTQITDGIPVDSGRMVIDVTPANANYVYILSANRDQSFQGVYRSTDSGTSFVIRDAIADPRDANPDILESEQAFYDLALGVSLTDPEEIYIGCLNVWKSSDGGTNFEKLNSWSQPLAAAYTHADIHMIRAFNGAMFVCSDGGIYSSTDGGINFTDHTAGIQASQFYKIAVSPNDANKMMGGLQDNGGHAYNDGAGNWLNYYGADGMDTAIDPVNDDVYYGFVQNGLALFISDDAGSSSTASLEKPIGSSGRWVTPLAANANQQIFAAYEKLYRLNNTRDGWIELADLGIPADHLEIAPSNNDIMYIAAGGVLKRSDDAGATVNDIANFGTIKGVAVHTTNPDIIWVTTSKKVFRSDNAGRDFKDITLNLPIDNRYVFFNDIVHQDGHDQNPVYLATSIGVYRIVDNGSWTPFFTNLPTTIVNDLEINTRDNSITAATYGRGIWRSSLPTCNALTAKLATSIDGGTPQEVSFLELCTGQTAKIDLEIISGNNPTYNWTGPNSFSSTESSLDFTNLSAGLSGIYTVIIESSDTCLSAEYLFSIDIEEQGVQPKSDDLQNICAEETVTLTATGSLDYKWYSEAAGDTPVGTGSSFVTPALTEDITYYVAGTSLPITTESAPSPGVSTASNYNFHAGLIFDATDGITLESFMVSAMSAGNRTIEVRSEQGDLLASTTVNIPEGESRVSVNLDIPRGKNHIISLPEGGLLEIRRTPAGNGVRYPYTSPSGIVSITGNTFNALDFYYFFYDWKFTSKGGRCESVRTPVHINVSRNDISESATYTVDSDEAVTLENNSDITLTEGSDLLLQLTGTTFEGSLTWTSPTGKIYTTNSINFDNIINNGTEEGNWSVKADFESDCGSASQIIDFSVKVKANNIEDIVIFPNPATDLITISSNDDFENTTITVFDMQGRELSDTIQINKAHSDQIELDIRSLAAGSYFVKIETNQKRLTKRIVKL